MGTRKHVELLLLLSVGKGSCCQFVMVNLILPTDFFVVVVV